jgi:hypothetical protein
MVAQDVKSTTGTHSKRLFSDRSITVEWKKIRWDFGSVIGRDHRLDARALGLRSLARQISSNPFFGYSPKIECIQK